MIPAVVSRPGKGQCEPSPAECREVAEFLQGFANPVRVEILCTLKDGEKSVGEIAQAVGAKQSNISQQLHILMAKGYVAKRREERNIFYRVLRSEIYKVMEHIFRLVCGCGLSGD
ncbi:MAG: metalloregulator ArsR/SmtB family transcription factor [Peptococcaceae bacterium]|jgi:ArsR family transcriptional regulator|nr:metalloregulator ArsR/SmtB family transcription factor [Peptococcaceae bacterium]